MIAVTEARAKAALLMIESTGAHYRLPDKGLVGPHAIFDPALLDTPDIDAAFIGQQDDRDWQIQVKRQGAVSPIHSPTTRWTRWAGMATWRRCA